MQASTSPRFNQLWKWYEVPSAADIELYLAEILKAARLVSEKYGAATAVLYVPAGSDYLRASGFSDDAIVSRLRAGGVKVIDGSLDPKNFLPATPLAIPGDGHPSPAAHHARAEILARSLPVQLVGMPDQMTGNSAAVHKSAIDENSDPGSSRRPF